MSSSVIKVSAADFLTLARSLPVADVRSPGEFLQGHIPGAVNIPLFTDRQRAMVGTIYTHKGRAEAVLTAMELISSEIPDKLRAAMTTAADGELLLYCWRGGMRSESMAWLASMAGLKPQILDGGYKSYRSLVLSKLSEERKLFILGGLTGSGKTKILNHLAVSGHQVVDLEGLACHKGSAFGSLGMPDQPSTEHFANLLFDEFSCMDQSSPVWLEDESRNIGTVFLPDFFYSHMQESPVVALIMPLEIRLPRLIAEYTTFPKEKIINSINRISKRLGGDKTHEAIQAIMDDDFATAIRIVLGYYDKTYSYGLSKRKEGQVICVETDTDDVEVNTARVCEAAGRILL